MLSKTIAGVDDPYEPPLSPEISIQNQKYTIQESVDIFLRRLAEEGCLVGGPTLAKGLPYPDGDEIVDLLVPADKLRQKLAEAAQLPKVIHCNAIASSCGRLISLVRTGLIDRY